jgi:hypothetical protein
MRAARNSPDFTLPPAEPESRPLVFRPGLPPRLRVIAAHLAERRAALAVAQMWWRYELGQVAHHVRYDTSGDFRPGILERLARAFDMKASTLRSYARVAEAIPEDEFAALMQHRDHFGAPLTWSHVEELVDAPDAVVRRLCAEAVVSERLSVRALAARVRAAAKP